MALSSLIFSHAFHFCLLSWAYQVPLGASVRATETEPDLANPSDLVLVQIADPQLGMLNMYTKPSDWSKEELMLQTLADKALAMKPQLVFLAGNMQNWWPNEKDPKKDRNRLMKMSDSAFEDLKALDLGLKQRLSVRQCMKSLVDEGIPVYYTPGNHDIGDDPDDEMLKRYMSGSAEEEGWGPLFQKVDVEESGIRFLQFNSQVYWSKADTTLEKYREEQLEFLKDEVKNIPGGTKLLVLLTHIPPFMDSFDEPEGWANWRQVYRKQILDVLAASELPLLFICGHFHANVVKDATYQGRPLNIRVSSAAGTTIQWDGKDSLTPEEAQKVASKRVLKAFAEDVGFANIKKRLRAQGDRSGLRVFRFKPESGTFEDHWYTVDELNS